MSSGPALALQTTAAAPPVRSVRRLQFGEWLLLARLALTGISFAIALGVELPGAEQAEPRNGLFWTVALAFTATAISGILVRRAVPTPRLALVQIATDVAVVTSLVYFSGARDSVFVFLYVVVTVYAALLFARWGAVSAATLSAICYAGVLLAANAGWPSDGRDLPEAIPVARLAVGWGVHVGALYLVGALASVLSRDLLHAGEALDRSASDLLRLRSLHERTVESIMSGLTTTDRDGRITSFNPEAERITGLPASEALGAEVEAVLPGVREVVARSRTGVAPTEPQRSRIRYRNRRGEDLHLGLAASILRGADGGPGGHIVIFQDVTQVVAMEEQLRRSERLAAAGELSAKMAHEIRNPLAAISGSVQLLRVGLSDTRGGAESRRLMDIVVREADRLSDLIQNFLQYARPPEPQVEAVDLGAMAVDVSELLASSRPADVVAKLDVAADVRVLADPRQLKQIVWNLLLNALQAMPDGGELRVAVTAEGTPQGAVRDGREYGQGGPGGEPRPERMARLCVTDTGSGIPPDVQDRILEPFFTTKKEGSGLGLSTVHRIIESHRGELRVESLEGRGTTFTVRLPLAEDAG